MSDIFHIPCIQVVFVMSQLLVLTMLTIKDSSHIIVQSCQTNYMQLSHTVHFKGFGSKIEKLADIHGNKNFPERMLEC